MADTTKSLKLLTDKEAIKTYIGIISGATCTDYMFKKYIERGMPARYEDNRWLAYSDNIDEFFRLYTRISMKRVPDEDKNDQELQLL